MDSQPVVLITGASTGFGRLFAETLARKHYRVFATMRGLQTKNTNSAQQLRALATSPAPDWSVRRKLNYISWARKVVAGLRGTNDKLEKQFDVAAQAAELSIGPAL